MHYHFPGIQSVSGTLNLVHKFNDESKILEIGNLTGSPLRQMRALNQKGSSLTRIDTHDMTIHERRPGHHVSLNKRGVM